MVMLPLGQPAFRAQVTFSDCNKANGGWEASGTIKNSGKASRTYRLTVFFTDSSNNVLGTGHGSFRIRAGQSGPWMVKTSYETIAHLYCVLAGVS
jgi:hypothetical protein